MSDRLFILFQYLLPQLLVSRLAGKLADYTGANALRVRVIRWFIGRYGVNMSEAEHADPQSYPTFNTFFTRALKPGLRPVVADAEAIASPVDGAISQLGRISDDRIFQAKGQSFGLTDLLGGDAQRAAPFTGGQFATIYLAPRDYHRIHMPVAGTLREMVYVPGKLFSVNPLTARKVPDLFARNERVVAIFDTDHGPMAMVLVGAMIVGSVETRWSGIVAPGNTRQVSASDYRHCKEIRYEKGEEMGRFRLGSTVILVFPKDRCQWETPLQEHSVVRMGERFGRWL